MTIRTFFVMLCVLFFLNPAYAGSICNDGTYSESEGRGTCSWHGGVAKDSYVYQPTELIQRGFGKSNNYKPPCTEEIQTNCYVNGWKPVVREYVGWDIASQSHKVSSISIDSLFWCRGEIIAESAEAEESSEIILGRFYAAQPSIKSTSYENSDGNMVYNKLLDNGDVLVLVDTRSNGAALHRWDRKWFDFGHGPIPCD